ncbi:MAG TPA: Wzz/FepE/Etk N-terminal domain-containing protein [Bacilli bacterium]|nr:Wzz/FepE/Etk N-terminal domain-containing protein [Bacilli bacterium]
MEILQYWKIIRQRLKLILTLTAVAVLAAGLVSFFVLKPEYEATATILVQSKSGNDQVAYNDVLVGQKLVKTYSEILKSRQIAEDVRQHLGLDLSNQQLLNKVRVTAANDSLVTSITVTDTKPEQAVAIANGFAQSFYANLGNIMKIDNVSILDEAKLPEHPAPVRPKPYLNMAIAFVLGLMAGVGLAFLLEFLDNTVKREEEIEELLGLPVLGVIALMDTDEKKGKKASKGVKVGGTPYEA